MECNDENRSLIWADVPDPVCGEDDCLVKIEACGVNRADLLQRAGDYPPPPGCPDWMGLEIAGTIIEIAEGAKEKFVQKLKINLFERVGKLGGNRRTGRADVLKRSCRRQSGSRLQLADKLEGVECVEKIDIARLAVEHLDRKLCSVCHINS